MMVVCRYLAVLIIMMSIIPLASALSFTNSPTVIPSMNIDTNSNLNCNFTINGEGTLQANISWFKYNTDWTLIVDKTGVPITSDTSFQTVFDNGGLNNGHTHKNERWICSVTVNNGTHSLNVNSSDVVINNTQPTMQVVMSNPFVCEDSLFTLNLTASDADGEGDFANWMVLADTLNNTPTFGNRFLINTNMSFLPVFEDIPEGETNGTHEISILAKDNEGTFGGDTINLNIYSVNDAPIFTSTPLERIIECPEDIDCVGQILASDEEDQAITFSSNEPWFMSGLNTGTGEFMFNDKPPGYYQVQINITDNQPLINGFCQNTENTATEMFYFNITPVNHAPNITFYTPQNIETGIQNQTENFIFQINASDRENHSINFSIENNCSLPSDIWNIQTIHNGSDGLDAIGLINVSFLTDINYTSNDFIMCRDFKIIVKDELDLITEIEINLNITNVNDNPIISDNSAFNENLEINKNNISNLTGAKGVFFSYKVNATDPDFYTYENDSWTYVINDTTLFAIDPISGILQSKNIPDETYVGINNILITVQDSHGLETSKTAFINITNNTQPIIGDLDVSSCFEEALCIKTLKANDTDVGENLTLTIDQVNFIPHLGSAYLLNITKFNKTFVLDNATTTEFEISFLPDDIDVGQYNISFYFMDSLGAIAYENLIFNVTNVNDIPVFDNNNDSSVIDPITFKPVVIDIPFTKIIYVHDDDLIYSIDTLTFNISNTTPKFNGTIGFNKNVANQTEILIFANSSIPEGLYAFNISVSDGHVLVEQSVNFTLYTQTLPPNITEIMPFLNVGNISNNYKLTTGSTEYILFKENQTIDFGAKLDIGLPPYINYTFSWYLDNSLLHASQDNTYSKYFDFFTNGTRDLTLQVEDQYYSKSNFTWNMEIENLNRRPTFIHDVKNMSGEYAIKGKERFNDIFKTRSKENIVFIDLDDDFNSDGIIGDGENNGLTFSLENDSNCLDMASFEFENGDLIITPTVASWCLTRFVATDADGKWVYSNQIRIEFDQVDTSSDSTKVPDDNPGTKTIKETIHMPIEEEVPEPEPFNLIIPGIAAIYSNGTVDIPIMLRNEWDGNIRNIHLSANASDPNVIIKFSKNDIPSMKKSETTNLTLTIENYRMEAPVELNISGHIKSLDYTDHATIYVNALENSGYDNGDAMQTRLGFARDLLSDNPECQELIEVLNAAEANAAIQKETSMQTINSVIKGCKYLINNAKPKAEEMPHSFIGKVVLYSENFVSMDTLSVIFVVLLMVAMLVAITSHIRLKKI